MDVQKKNGNEITFDFQDEHLSYQFKDGNGSQSLKADYLGIDIISVDSFIERNDWFRNVGILWLIMSGYIFLVDRMMSIWLYLWVGMLATYYLRTSRFSVLKSDAGKILILRDKKHDAILENIRSEKKKLLREKYFFLDKDNSPDTEIRKYQYLKDDGAITHDEFETASKELLDWHGVTKKIWMA